MELKLFSPVEGDSISFTWPMKECTFEAALFWKKKWNKCEILQITGIKLIHNEQDGKEIGDNIIDTIRWACKQHGALAQIVDSCILQNYDTKSYESLSKVCVRYNKAVDSAKQLSKGSSLFKKSFCLPSMKLVQHIIQQCYSHAVKDPDALNHYEPFSPEVYGETSFDLVEQIIETIQIGEDDYFIDLGSGVGQVVLQVAAAANCRFCYGIEKADRPSAYAMEMDKQFQRWISFFGKSCGNYLLEKGDFLVKDIQERIESASVIFVNNYAFGPQVDHHLKFMFANMKEGAKIVSSKAFCPLNFRISDRNLSDIGSIIQVQELSPLLGAVSWTGRAFAYYVHTIDRTLLERYFQRMKKLNVESTSPRRDRRGRIKEYLVGGDATSRVKEYGGIRDDGDCAYRQPVRTLYFGDSSNSSAVVSVFASDDSNSMPCTVAASTADNRAASPSGDVVFGPTTRRKWTEYINRLPSATPVGTCAVVTSVGSTVDVKSSKIVSGKHKQKKRTGKGGVSQQPAVSHVAHTVPDQRPISNSGKLSKFDGTIVRPAAVKFARKKKVKSDSLLPALSSLESLHLLHKHTVMSTTGNNACLEVSQAQCISDLFSNVPSKPVRQNIPSPSLPSIISAVDQMADLYRKQLLSYLSYVQTSEFAEEVVRQRDIALASNQILRLRQASYEKEIYELQKECIELIKSHIHKLGFAANTPNELMTLCGKMKDHYEILKDHVSSLRMANAALRVEQDHLVSSLDSLSEKNNLSVSKDNIQTQFLDRLQNGLLCQHEPQLAQRSVSSSSNSTNLTVLPTPFQHQDVNCTTNASVQHSVEVVTAGSDDLAISETHRPTSLIFSSSSSGHEIFNAASRRSKRRSTECHLSPTCEILLPFPALSSNSSKLNAVVNEDQRVSDHFSVSQTMPEERISCAADLCAEIQERKASYTSSVVVGHNVASGGLITIVPTSFIGLISSNSLAESVKHKCASGVMEDISPKKRKLSYYEDSIKSVQLGCIQNLDSSTDTVRHTVRQLKDTTPVGLCLSSHSVCVTTQSFVECPPADRVAVSDHVDHRLSLVRDLLNFHEASSNVVSALVCSSVDNAIANCMSSSTGVGLECVQVESLPSYSRLVAVSCGDELLNRPSHTFASSNSGSQQPACCMAYAFRLPTSYHCHRTTSFINSDSSNLLTLSTIDGTIVPPNAGCPLFTTASRPTVCHGASLSGLTVQQCSNTSVVPLLSGVINASVSTSPFKVPSCAVSNFQVHMHGQGQFSPSTSRRPVEQLPCQYVEGTSKIASHVVTPMSCVLSKPLVQKFFPHNLSQLPANACQHFVPYSVASARNLASLQCQTLPAFSLIPFSDSYITSAVPLLPSAIPSMCITCNCNLIKPDLPVVHAPAERVLLTSPMSALLSTTHQAPLTHCHQSGGTVRYQAMRFLGPGSRRASAVTICKTCCDDSATAHSMPVIHRRQPASNVLMSDSLMSGAVPRESLARAGSYACMPKSMPVAMGSLPLLVSTCNVELDVFTELAIEGVLSDLLYADDLVLLSETIEGLWNLSLEVEGGF